LTSSLVAPAVSDTGMGIAPEFLPHVFERFRQHDSSIPRSHGGLGIGLAIVKHLIELHGGEVRAKSQGLGQGATFIVSLPVRAAAREPQDLHPGTSPASTLIAIHASDALKGIDVLVVDDDADARDVVERVLIQVGAVVRTAASADQADALLDRAQPDILVSDLGMSPRDGFDFIRKVRARDAEIPAVALTAFARTEDRLAALHAGYQAHLAKPVVPAELIAVVASLTRHLTRLKQTRE
jgi:CheY-like chemotaxis protein